MSGRVANRINMEKFIHDKTYLPEHEFYDRYKKYGGALAYSTPFNIFSESHILDFMVRNGDHVDVLRKINSIQPMSLFWAERLLFILTIHEGFFDAFLCLYNEVFPDHRPEVRYRRPCMGWFNDQGSIHHAYRFEDPSLIDWFSRQAWLNPSFYGEEFILAASEGRLRMMQWLITQARKTETIFTSLTLKCAEEAALKNNQQPCVAFVRALMQRSNI